MSNPKICSDDGSNDNDDIDFDDDNEEDWEDVESSSSPKRSWSSSTITMTNTTLPTWTIVCILSTAFSYGCIFSTLFLITLPVECERISQEHPTVPKSVSLGVFVAIAGVTQLISPLIGRLSDMYVPPLQHELGQRMPYLILGSVCTILGLLGQMAASYGGFWVRYSAFFFLHMLGLNIMYAMMLALIPDQVPQSQTGVANGILAFQLVMGSLFGFGLFYAFFNSSIQSMYSLYIISVIVTTICTGTHAHDRDAELAVERQDFQQQRRLKELQQQQDASSSELTHNNNSNRHHHHHHHHKRPNDPARISRRPWQKAAHKAAKRARQVLVMTPTRILKSMLIDTFQSMDWSALRSSYSVDASQYPDFLVVTVSRLFYYSGMSIQTFFLYYVHDMLHITQDPQGVVARLAIIGQCSAALICYPVGVCSDRMSGKRQPWVYLACTLLTSVSLSLIWITTLQQMVVAIAILGIANGIYLTMDTSLAVDTLPSNVEDSAQLLGVWGVAAFLGSALGPMIGGPLLFLVGGVEHTHVEDDDDDDASYSESYGWMGYVVILSLCAIYFVISAMLLFFFLSNNNKNKQGKSDPSDDNNKNNNNTNHTAPE